MSVALWEERPTRRGGRPRLSRTRKWLIGSTLAAYGAVVIGVLTTSWLVRLDWQLVLFRPYKQWPEYHVLLEVVVVLGQRGPTALIVSAWLVWRAWKHRDPRPLLVLGLALLLLNLSVGAVKHGLGRLGPHYATTVGSSEMFSGGDIFPSGHTANAVVTWGVLAYLATKHRRTGAVITAVFAFTVGMTTIYLGTHWVTDVLAGWTAGILIMLVLPLFEPLVERAGAHIRALWARRVGEPRLRPVLVSAPGTAVVTQRLARSEEGTFARTPVVAGARSGHSVDQRLPHHTPARRAPAPTRPPSARRGGVPMGMHRDSPQQPPESRSQTGGSSHSGPRQPAGHTGG